ncbi:MAG: 7-carboxy-7-deazaguanine synthase QueE [Bacteroidales bacterium]|jgi:organic radical activating enzyme|nr:7-carboxy-7-deazaguanine synthase QueE [Bacteroidales bacterium]
MKVSEDFNELHTFPIVETFYSLQGEGFHTGKAAYFIRFGGCTVCCGWCDVKESWNPHVHPRLTSMQIVEEILKHQAHAVVVTGGEPLMHNLDELCALLHQNNIQTFLETSGTFKMTGEWDWVCLSPKQKHKPLDENFAKANELKVIIATPEDLAWAEECAVKVQKKCMLYLQPEYSVSQYITPIIVAYCKQNPQWRISLQTHKFIDIP